MCRHKVLYGAGLSIILLSRGGVVVHNLHKGGIERQEKVEPKQIRLAAVVSLKIRSWNGSAW